MFYWEKKNNTYWIWEDGHKGKFGPFEGIYVKNNVYGHFPAPFPLKDYPGYKYAIGKIKKNYIIINKTEISEII